ncbi:MAG: MFS transporter [Streptosporangiaceae bacterium]
MTTSAASSREPGLWTRPFTLLAAGQAVSRLGDGLFATAVTWTALQSRGATGVALVASAATAPLLLSSLIGASYADRHDRRRLMIGADVIRLVLIAGLAGALLHGRLPILALAGFALAEGSASAIFTPARMALVPAVVPAGRLLRANGILQACFMASFGIGPLLLAPLLAFTDMPGVVAIDAATFAVSAASLAAIRLVPSGESRADLGLRRDLAAGWRAVRAAPDVLLVLGTFVAALILASGFLSVGLPAWVSRAHGGAGTLGLLQGAAGIAQLAGALVLARLRLRRLALMAVGAWGVLGGFRLFLGGTDRLAIGLPLMAATGLASAATDIPLLALLQTTIPGRHLGKAMALWYTGIAAATTISPPLAALAIHAWGLTVSFALSGSALVALSGLSAFRLTRRRAAEITIQPVTTQPVTTQSP